MKTPFPAVDERPPGYPADLERTLTLPDGRTVFIRPLLPADAAQMAEEISTLDEETLYRRFMTPRPQLDADRIRYLASVDYRWRMALGVVDEDGNGVWEVVIELQSGRTYEYKYVIDGGMQDWFFVWGGNRDITLEVGQVKWPPASELPDYWDDNLESMLQYFERSLEGLRGTVTDGETGAALSAARISPTIRRFSALS